MFNIGDRIVIKYNAFEGSDELQDFEWRGKKAEVIDDLGDGAYEVYVKGKGTCLLKSDEMESAA